jgi:hypothetical protein
LLDLERLGVRQLNQADLAVDHAEHPARCGYAFLQLRLQSRRALERRIDQQSGRHEAHEVAEAQISPYSFGAGEIDR